PDRPHPAEEKNLAPIRRRLTSRFRLRFILSVQHGRTRASGANAGEFSANLVQHVAEPAQSYPHGISLYCPPRRGCEACDFGNIFCSILEPISCEVAGSVVIQAMNLVEFDTPMTVVMSNWE